MEYPQLQEVNKQRDYIDAFGGYNHNLKIAANEFYDIENMTSDYYPVLSPRAKRGEYSLESSGLVIYNNNVLGFPIYKTGLKVNGAISAGTITTINFTGTLPGEAITTNSLKDRMIRFGEVVSKISANTENTIAIFGRETTAAIATNTGIDIFNSYIKVSNTVCGFSAEQIVPYNKYLTFWQGMLESYSDAAGKPHTYYNPFYINIDEPSDFGYINAVYTLTSNDTNHTITYQMCELDGENENIDQGLKTGLQVHFELTGDKSVSHVIVEGAFTDGTAITENSLVGKYIRINNVTAKIRANDAYNSNYWTIQIYAKNFGAAEEHTPIEIYDECALIQKTAPKDPKNGDYWIDTSDSKNHVVKRYSEATDEWVQVITSYIKISAYNIAEKFKKDDAVRISGVRSSFKQLYEQLNKKVSVIQDLYHDSENPENDYIIVIGICDRIITQELSQGTFAVIRMRPRMDYIIESGNRLWGCKYGTNNDGEAVNEIYASRLGDITNWNYFGGTSVDSYAASVGSYGPFTGAISYLGNPIFFKEKWMHKVYGDYPANYQIQSTECDGLQKGSHWSLKTVGDVLFYKSKAGVMQFSGSLPVNVSGGVFGGICYNKAANNNASDMFSGAAAGVFNNKYYISMRSEKDNNWYLFVYDPAKGIWHRESASGRISCFNDYNDDLYYYDTSTGKIKTIGGSGTKEGNFGWYAETGIMTSPYVEYSGQTALDHKYISKINIRMSLDVNSQAMIYAEYDSSGTWEHLTTLSAVTLRTFTVPIRPKRCDHLRLRIEGTGNVKIFAIAKTIEQGSDSR